MHFSKINIPVISVSLFLISSVSALAVDACDIYADTAVAQHDKNVQSRCAFGGLRWHSDRHAHRSYCSLVGPVIAEVENTERARQLQQCGVVGNNNNNQNHIAVVTFQCQGRNSNIRFVYSDDPQSNRLSGEMFLSDVLLADLKIRRVNKITVRATIRGNGLGEKFVLNTDRRKVYIADGNAEQVLCNADITAIQ